MRDHVTYEVVGSTRDDAAGEAFDKVARLLGLPYPGGPHLSILAEQGNPAAFSFARPMLHAGNLDFSFSGLKTEVLYVWRKLSVAEQEKQRAHVAASFQQAVVDTLVGKTLQAVEKFQPSVVLLAGGVAANNALRQQMQMKIGDQGIPLQIAPLQLCGDNAVMIGLAGVHAFEAGRKTEWRMVDAHARLDLAQMSKHNL